MNLHVLHGTCEDVKSYEGKRAVMVAPIITHVFAQHEAHVRFKRKVFGSLSGYGVRSGATYCSPPHEAVEIGDGGGFDSWRRQEDMEQGTVGTEELQTSRYRRRGGCCGAMASAISG